MTRFIAGCSALVALVATWGCGGSKTTPDRTEHPPTDSGSGGGVGPGAPQGTGGDNRGGVGPGVPQGIAGADLEGVAGGGQGGAGGEAPGAAGSGPWLYETVDEGAFPKDRVLDIQVTMSQDAWARLITTAEQEVWSTAAVTIDGQGLGSIGMRPKGEYSLDSCVDEDGNLVCEKLSFKLKFNEIDPEGRFYGLKRLVLNKITDGWALYGESLAYQIFNDFGVTAPRTSYATLTVNGESLGIYRVVEAVDGRFTQHHFAQGDGNLYKEAWPVTTDDSYFASRLETNEETASHEALTAFAADMLAASDDELPQTLDRYLDLERMLDYMAVDYAVANWDGITTFYCGDWEGCGNHNYYLYQTQDAATFTLIPWDLNAVFSLGHWLGDIEPWDKLDVNCDTPIPTGDGELGTLPAACDPTIRAVALSRDGYHASVQRLLDEVFVLDRLSEKIDEYARQVAPVMREDPFVDYSQVSDGAESLKDALPALRSRLEAVLTGETVDPGGSELTTTSIAEFLCGASSALDCYDEDTCVSHVEAGIVSELVDTCPLEALEEYAECLLGEDQPTTCADGALVPNSEVCVNELQPVLDCAGSVLASGITGDE